MGGSRSGSLNPTCNYEAILKSSSANLSEGSITWSIGTIATPRCSYRPFYPLEWSLNSMGFESLRQGQPITSSLPAHSTGTTTSPYPSSWRWKPPTPRTGASDGRLACEDQPKLVTLLGFLEAFATCPSSRAGISPGVAQ